MELWFLRQFVGLDLFQSMNAKISLCSYFVWLLNTVNCYLFHSMEMRKILDEEKPGMTFAEMNALIAVKWKVGAGFFLNELISSLYTGIMDKNVNLPFCWMTAGNLWQANMEWQGSCSQREVYCWDGGVQQSCSYNLKIEPCCAELCFCCWLRLLARFIRSSFVVQLYLLNDQGFKAQRSCGLHTSWSSLCILVWQ